MLVIVNPKLRGKGLGKKIMDYCENYAKELFPFSSFFIFSFF